MNTLTKFLKGFDFEGHPLLFITYRGRPCLMAHQVGEALGYARGKDLSAQITREWADEFKLEYHYDILRGAELAEFKTVVEKLLDGKYPSTDLSKVQNLTILYEPGIYLAALLTKKPAGKRLRARLAEEILPEIARTGGYGGASINEGPASTDTELNRRGRYIAQGPIVDDTSAPDEDPRALTDCRDPNDVALLFAELGTRVQSLPAAQETVKQPIGILALPPPVLPAKDAPLTLLQAVQIAVRMAFDPLGKSQLPMTDDELRQQVALCGRSGGGFQIDYVEGRFIGTLQFIFEPGDEPGVAIHYQQTSYRLRGRDLVERVREWSQVGFRRGGPPVSLLHAPRIEANTDPCTVCGVPGGRIHHCCPCKEKTHGHPPGQCGTRADGAWSVNRSFGWRRKKKGLLPCSWCKVCKNWKGPEVPYDQMAPAPQPISPPPSAPAPSPALAAPAQPDAPAPAAEKPSPTIEERVPALAVPAVPRKGTERAPLLGPGAADIAEALSAAASAPPPAPSPWTARLPEEPAPVLPPASPAQAAALAAAAKAPAVAAASAGPVIEVGPKKPKGKPDARGKDRTAGYKHPSLDLLDYREQGQGDLDLRKRAQHLKRTLADHGVKGRITEIHPGPVVTMFEFVPAAGTKVNRIESRWKELSMAMEGLRVRIVAPLPGKAAVGIEVPNQVRQTIFLKEVLASPGFRQSKLTLALGMDTRGAAFCADLAKMPHLLLAGATGTGKSVSMNAMVSSLLYGATPDEVRMIMIDPKRLELSVYEGIPHLLLPVVTEMDKVRRALRWAVEEMERRYKLIAEHGARDIDGYNQKIAERADKSQGPQKLPYIVLLIDEFADLMVAARKEVENAVQRLAQKARAAGIHLILATQRPSVDVITGVIKTNFRSRIAFQVPSKVDSRVILDTPGAENLLGMGDMLFTDRGQAPQRVHGALVTDEEVHRLVEHLKKQGKPVYNMDILKGFEGEKEEKEPLVDEMYEQAVRAVIESRHVSISMLQRKLHLGYPRAARLIERMEKEGIISADGGGGRDVLATP